MATSWQRAWAAAKVVSTMYSGTHASSEDEAIRLIRELSRVQQHQIEQRLQINNDYEAAKWIAQNG